jgi:hypothetical protein
MLGKVLQSETSKKLMHTYTTQNNIADETTLLPATLSQAWSKLF